VAKLARGDLAPSDVPDISHPNRAVHHVYIVCCADGSLYTGYARDPVRRVAVHNSGRGARYTSGRRPVRLVYSESFDAIGEALQREHQLKRWPRRKKEALIAACGSPPDYRTSSLGGTNGRTVVPRKIANAKASRNVASTTCGPTSRR